jgi:hypothetical protein
LQPPPLSSSHSDGTCKTPLLRQRRARPKSNAT